MEDVQTFEFLANQANTAAEKKIVTTEKGDTFLLGDDVREWHKSTLARGYMQMHTLAAIVDYIKAGADGRQELFIHVNSPEQVTVLSPLDEYGNREKLIDAVLSSNQFEFGYWQDRESLNIALQSQFVKNNDRDALLTFIGNYEESNSSNATDDGVTQTATIKTGAASRATAKVPNPVTLKPFRTFPEVDQPESQFIFRMREGMQGALFEADNGAWKNAAINNIKQYLAANIESDKMHILG